MDIGIVYLAYSALRVTALGTLRQSMGWITHGVERLGKPREVTGAT